MHLFYLLKSGGVAPLRCGAVMPIWELWGCNGCTAALILELLTGGKFCCRYFGADCYTVASFLLYAAGRWILLKWILI
jgi:hypothetical protein